MKEKIEVKQDIKLTDREQKIWQSGFDDGWKMGSYFSMPIGFGIGLILALIVVSLILFYS